MRPDLARRAARLQKLHRAPWPDSVHLQKLPSFFFSDQAGNANRKSLIDNLEFGPGQLRTRRSQRHVISLNPLRCDDSTFPQVEEIANAEFPDRDRDIDFDRQPADKGIHTRAVFAREDPGRFNQGHFGRHLGLC